jgi:hypothetical protein
MQFKTIAAAAALAVSLAAPAFAQTMTTTTTETTRSFAAPEREMISKYYSTHRDAFGTPTTTVTTVTRGQALPGTVQVRELPSELVTQLPPITTPNYRRVLVGNQVVLVDHNNMVVDVLPLGG